MLILVSVASFSVLAIVAALGSLDKDKKTDWHEDEYSKHVKY